MSNLFNRKKTTTKRTGKAFRSFENRCLKEKSINLNPLLAIIINLVPMFLIVLNMKAIVGFEQTNIPEATFSSDKSIKSKKTFSVDLKLYKNSTRVIVRDHKGAAVESKKFKNITLSKDKIVKYLGSRKQNMDHLSILTPGSRVKFDEIGQAIDLGSLKIGTSTKKLFTNFSIGNIL